MEGEAGVGLGVLMGAIEQGFGRQRPDAAEAFPELLRLALEHPPAAEREDAVADERQAGLRQVIGDVSVGVARDVDHPRLPVSQRYRIAIGHYAVDR